MHYLAQQPFIKQSTANHTPGVAARPPANGGRLKPQREITDPRIIKMLAHPLRIQILRHLEKETASPTALSAALEADVGTVSYHVRTLHRHGFITLVKTTPRRGAIEHFYKAEEHVWFTNEAWGQLPEIVKHQALNASLGIIGEKVRCAAISGGFSAPDIHLHLFDLDLDEDGWSYISDVLLEARHKIKEYEGGLAKARIARDKPRRRAAVAVLMFDDNADDSIRQAQPEGPRPKRRSKRRGQS